MDVDYEIDVEAGNPAGLTERARAWTEGIHGEFCGTSLRAAEERPCHDVPAFKPW
jgi:hypothetical protein